MPLPRRVFPAGIEFAVSSAAIDDHGVMDGNARTICVKSDLPDKAANAVLLHEWLHALFSSTGWSEVLSDGQEEGLCLLLEHHLAPYVANLGEPPERMS